MTDTTVNKVSSGASPVGPDGQVYLVSGKRMALRLWRDEAPTIDKPSGRAELLIDGQSIRLEPGDSWLVPAGSDHTYRILESFTAVETTAPPFQVHGRE